MRRTNGALPVRDVCRTFGASQPQQQRRVLSSVAACPSYAWPAATCSTASFPLPSFSLALPSTSKAQATRRTRSWLTSPYSTSSPAYPLPGSNNEIDPRGIDYSLFEPEDGAYTQHASTSKLPADTRELDHYEVSASAASLSPPTQLLLRLLKSGDFESATTVLSELQALRTPLDEPLPIFSSAALWAIQHGRKDDMLTWLKLCPGLVPGTELLSTASSTARAQQFRVLAKNFRKCFMILLDSHGDDLRLLQRASMIAAEKGFWSVIQSTLAQILRFGMGRMQGNNVSNPEAAWEYFNRLVLANKSQRGLREEGRRKEILAATVGLRTLYNLGIRTLALAGRLDDAKQWAEKCAQIERKEDPLSQIFRIEAFTENMLLEELVRAGGKYIAEARSLAQRLARSPARPDRQSVVDMDAITERIKRETAFSSSADNADVPLASSLDDRIRAHLTEGDVVAARDRLLSVLRSATRVRHDDDAPLPSEYFSSSSSTFSHLPSAATLSALQDFATKLGTIPITTSLTESDMSSSSSSAENESYETLTSDEFLRPIRARLSSVRAGQGLYETAQLYGLVKKGKWKDAMLTYVSKSGFKIPSGGITTALISTALGSDSLTPSSDGTKEGQQRRGKQWPSTHAISLLLKAVTSQCVDSGDFSRLEKVYGLWKDASLPNDRSKQTEGEEGDMAFQQWPPNQRPDSYTFDPFLHAFARLRSSDTPSSPWGSSQAVLSILRDMTEVFSVRPSISSWTIALECLAREGLERWESTTSVLARAVGINAFPDTQLLEQDPSFPEANLATYTALIRALIRVGKDKGGSLVTQAGTVRDDLLFRTTNMDHALRELTHAETDEEEIAFYEALLSRWTILHAEDRIDERQCWPAQTVLSGNQGRTLEALREVWHLETAEPSNSP